MQWDGENNTKAILVQNAYVITTLGLALDDTAVSLGGEGSRKR